ncbi:protein ABHD13-like [Rhopilema esculentum]|uniref:protein ABHD13-like n=1 Tax=Rhopilema esculentum TaxID=499914 RepID=UPI0031DD4DFF|eukprot:gene8483-14478_t
MLPDDNYIPANSGFRTIEKVAKFVLILIYRCWRGCSAGILSLILLYWMYGGVVIFLLLASALVGAFYHFQDGLLYFPDQPESSRFFVQSPHKLGIPFENSYIKSKDGIQINILLLKQAERRLSVAPTLIYFHGNAGNIGHRLLNAHLVYTYSGCNVLLVEYRGYGRSEGSPSEKGLYSDAEAALEFLLKRDDIDHERIILYGRSLGGAVAIDLATNQDYSEHIFALIIENTFTSIPDIACHMFPWIQKLPIVCYRNQFLSMEKIKMLLVPTLFISGLADQLVPPAMMLDLYNASTAPMKRLETFVTGTHNDTWQCYGYSEVINKFLNEVVDARNAGLVTKPLRRTNQMHESERKGMPKDI